MNLNEQVTILIYTFPKPGAEDVAFAKIVASIEQTWRFVGHLKTVIVASHHFAAVDDFVAKHPEVELQIEPTLVPGKIKTMSMDCIKRLYTRFLTPYVLIIQDDGFPIRKGLEEFLSKCDFYGAPIISDGWKRKLAYAIGMGSFNGGFSLRSRALCEHASKKWYSFFSKFMSEDNRHLGEDFFYTTLLRFLPSTWRMFKFPSERESFCFSFDSLGGRVALPVGKVSPFGIHGHDTPGVMTDVDSVGKRRDIRPVISFCMLTWNRAPMLRMCIRSFLDRISRSIPYELIVMDNASSDGTGAVLDAFLDHPNIRIVRNQKNLRLNAYKSLFGIARGDFIVDMDDDILEFPESFDKTIVDYFDAYPDYGYLCLNVVQDDKTQGHKPGPECYHEDRRDDKVVEEGPVGGWCAAFRRRHYRLFKFFFNRMNLSMSRVEDGALSGFLHVVLRQRQGVIKNAVCLHATGPYYAERFGLLKRETEKYEAAGLLRAAKEFSV